MAPASHLTGAPSRDAGARANRHRRPPDSAEPEQHPEEHRTRHRRGDDLVRPPHGDLPLRRLGRLPRLQQLAQLVHDLVGLGPYRPLRHGPAAEAGEPPRPGPRPPRSPDGSAARRDSRRAAFFRARRDTGMAHSWYFVPDLVTTSLVYPDRREAISPQGSTTSRKGLRIRSRSSFADTAGRSVKAVTSGTTSSSVASATHGVRPSPATIASMPSHAARPSSSTPPAMPAGDR
ncbi:hypothetical protein SGLAM104S_01872 [Streptomyces glaucescens]